MYRAFISYRHVGYDRGHAEHMETSLKRYAKPIWKPPMRIFRDERAIKAGESLPDAIRRGLDASRFLIYLASPAAAASSWVQDELTTWCGKPGRADSLLIVHIGGDIAVDVASKTIVWERSNALPACLRPYVPALPMYVDLSWAKTREQQDLNHAEYRTAINALAARIRGVSPEWMNDQEVITHRRNMWFLRATLAVVCLSLAGVGMGLRSAALSRADAAGSRAAAAVSRAAAAEADVAKLRAEAEAREKAIKLAGEERGRLEAEADAARKLALRHANRALVLSYSERDPAKAIAYALRSAQFAPSPAVPLRISRLLWDLPAHQTLVFERRGPPPIVPIVQFHDVRSLRLAKGGRMVVVHDSNDVVTLWSVASGRRVGRYPAVREMEIVSVVLPNKWAKLSPRIRITDSRDTLVLLRTDGTLVRGLLNADAPLSVIRPPLGGKYVSLLRDEIEQVVFAVDAHGRSTLVAGTADGVQLPPLPVNGTCALSVSATAIVTCQSDRHWWTSLDELLAQFDTTTTVLEDERIEASVSIVRQEEASVSVTSIYDRYWGRFKYATIDVLDHRTRRSVWRQFINDDIIRVVPEDGRIIGLGSERIEWWQISRKDGALTVERQGSLRLRPNRRPGEIFENWAGAPTGLAIGGNRRLVAMSHGDAAPLGSNRAFPYAALGLLELPSSGATEESLIELFPLLPADDVMAIAIARENHRVATLSNDGLIRIYDINIVTSGEAETLARLTGGLLMPYESRELLNIDEKQFLKPEQVDAYLKTASALFRTSLTEEEVGAITAPVEQSSVTPSRPP